MPKAQAGRNTIIEVLDMDKEFDFDFDIYCKV